MPTYHVLELLEAIKVYVSNHPCSQVCDHKVCGCTVLTKTIHTIERPWTGEKSDGQPSSS